MDFWYHGSMNIFVRGIAGALIAIILSSVSFAGHASAMQMRGMERVAHDRMGNANCLTVCQTTTIKPITQNERELQDDDDEPGAAPAAYYLQLRTAYLAAGSPLRTCQSVVKPPPKVPLYVWNCVSRF